MYLLNLQNAYEGEQSIFDFTFHNVSIKSINDYSRTARMYGPLHSTMYLLNRGGGGFGFGNQAALHSTMYLLNRDGFYAMNTEMLNFTFHNVSIKSKILLMFLNI